MNSSRAVESQDRPTRDEQAKHLLKACLHTDCQFLVGPNGSNKELIQAHKLYLAQRSSVFKTMLFGKMTEGAVTNELISITDLTPSSFKDLLHYIYNNSVDLQSMDQAMDLYYAAKKYILPADLVAVCALYIMINLSPEYLCSVLEFASLVEDNNLKEKCLSFLRRETKESLASPDFEELSESTLLCIVKEGVLNISELELFKAVTRWAGHQCAQRDLEINGTNMRQMLHKIIGDIWFLAMKLEEFTSSPALSGILTEEESSAIFKNLNNLDRLSMPDHLSTCRYQRSAHSLHENVGPSTKNCGNYCLRSVENESLIMTEPFVNSTTMVVVDRAVFCKGVIFAGMILADQQVFNQQGTVIYCQLSDLSGTKVLASAKVSHQDLHRQVTHNTEAFFNCSVRLKPNKTYRIGVSVSRRAQFFSGMASSVVSSQGVRFKFLVQTDLVRGIIFDLC